MLVPGAIPVLSPIPALEAIILTSVLLAALNVQLDTSVPSNQEPPFFVSLDTTARKALLS